MSPARRRPAAAWSCGAVCTCGRWIGDTRGRAARNLAPGGRRVIGQVPCTKPRARDAQGCDGPAVPRAGCPQATVPPPGRARAFRAHARGQAAGPGFSARHLEKNESEIQVRVWRDVLNLQRQRAQ